jgi:hypothetical protein
MCMFDTPMPPEHCRMGFLIYLASLEQQPSYHHIYFLYS